jgi:hypothetical protein
MRPTGVQSVAHQYIFESDRTGRYTYSQIRFVV